MKKDFRFKKSKKQLLLIPLSLAVAAVSCPFVSFAEQTAVYSDLESHWATSEIMKWSSYGVLQGFDGKFHPDASITRGEMAVVLNKIMNYQKTAENSFEDVDNAFYKDPILKAFAAGVMSGSDNKMRPKDNITQQEAIALLARAFEVEKSSTSTQNYEKVADWAKGDVFGMGAIGALDGIRFEAEKPITRAEVVKVIDNVVGQFYNIKGEYEADTEDSVVINTPDVVLKNCSVKGDVIISEGVGDGDVTLENVKISGRLLVHGGGTNTVKLNGCTVNTVSVDKKTGSVRILSENSTKIINTIVISETTLQGSFENVSIVQSPTINLKADIKNLSVENGSSIIMESGKIKEVFLNAEGTQFKVDSQASVEALTASKKVNIEVKGQINKVQIEKSAENTKLNGNGKILQVSTNASKVEINTSNTTIKLGKGVKEVTQNGKEVTAADSTSDSTSKKSSSGGGGGGGGSSSSTTSFTIDKVESTANNTLQFSLNKKANKALDKNAIHLIHTKDGKEITVTNITTQDNKTYTVTTENCENGTYRLDLMIDGKKIQKEFTIETPQTAFIIDKIESTANDTIQFALNQKTEKALDKNAVYVVRIKDGKEIAVTNITTQDNKTYTVTTENCESGTYRLDLMVDGKKIQKEFTIETPQTAFAIDKIESVSNGILKVTLNQRTEKALDKNAFNIICTGGGKDMTILNVTTQDNKVYNLTTAYYNDNTYNLEITLADGTRIDKDFETKFDCAEIEMIEAKRAGETTASLTYNSDAPGFFYYLLQPKQAARAVSSQEPTAQEVIQKGIRTEMKVHSNTITISNLTKDTAYDMYYVAVDVDDRITPVRSIFIDAKAVETPDQGEISIKTIKPFKENTNDAYKTVYGFEIVLSAPTAQTLELSNFEANCPRGPATLGEVKTTDNQTYKLYYKKGTIPFSNNTYTITITFADGKEAQSKVYLDLQAPILSFRSFEWKDENTLIATINSDEAGNVYYSILDDSEDFYTSAPKDPTPIYANGTKIPIGYGETRITLENPEAGKWFCFAPEDEYGNRTAYFSCKQIPAYVPPAPEEPEALKILDIEVVSATGQPKLKVTLSDTVNLLAIQDEYTEISGFNNTLRTGHSFENGALNASVVYIIIMNVNEIPAGSHDLTLWINDEKLVYTFNVEQVKTIMELNEKETNVAEIEIIQDETKNENQTENNSDEMISDNKTEEIEINDETKNQEQIETKEQIETEKETEIKDQIETKKEEEKTDEQITNQEQIKDIEVNQPEATE